MGSYPRPRCLSTWVASAWRPAGHRHSHTGRCSPSHQIQAVACCVLRVCSDEEPAEHVTERPDCPVSGFPAGLEPAGSQPTHTALHCVLFPNTGALGRPPGRALCGVSARRRSANDFRSPAVFLRESFSGTSPTRVPACHLRASVVPGRQLPQDQVTSANVLLSVLSFLFLRNQFYAPKCLSTRAAFRVLKHREKEKTGRADVR